ncbi:sensor histidine kinase [Paenibacillus tarimensis]
MFNKLRNRLLVVNMVTISVMMLMAFASIYMITYSEMRKDIWAELDKVGQFYDKPPGYQDHEKHEIDHSKETVPMHPDPMQERSFSFAIRTDKQWNILSVSSIFEEDLELYKLAVDAASSQNKDTGLFKLDGYEWAFSLKPTFDGYRLVCVDVTARQGILTNLIYTFLFVASVMLVVIFFISRYFANRSIKPVKEAFDKQKQFVADASHELKTPLAIIGTNTDVLLANSEDTIQSQAKWIHYIKSETERMTKLTNDLLYLTEMDASRASMIHTAFSVSDAVESVILTMEAIIFEKHIGLNYEIENDLTAFGNSEQIKQVVMILLDNAVKYTNLKGSIDITLRKQHNEILLSITNTGEGIAPEHLERIFDRFYRTDKSRARKYGGYGLGLAIAKSIIDQHKGKIYAKSAIGEKTTFYVQLPLVSG